MSYFYCFVESRINCRAAPIPGIGIGIVPIPAIFDGIGIAQVSYTSTNSVDCTLY